MKCPYCNTPIEEGDRFCNECGADLSQLKRCPHCNAFIEKGDKFCNNCGADISSVSNKVAANQSVESDAPVIQPRIASAIDDDDDFEEESFFERYKGFIIVGVILIACVVGFFIYRWQTPKPTLQPDTQAVDTIDTSVADDIAVDTTTCVEQQGVEESRMPSFDEIKDFVFKEENSQKKCMKNIGLSLLYEYNSSDDESDVFYGKDAEIARNDDGDYTFIPKSDHAFVIQIHKGEYVNRTIFLTPEDNSKFRKQSEDSGFDPSNLHFYGEREIGDYTWCEVEFL